MKQRIISALVGLVILAVVFLLMGTLLFNVVIAFLGSMAVYELLNATGVTKSRSMTVLSLGISLVIPFAQEENFRAHLPPLMFCLVIVFFLILLRQHETLRVEQAAMAFLFAIFVPVFFSSAVFIRNDYGVARGGFYLLWALGSAWLSDSGAYFTGLKWGKRKLAPKVSPKKTVEGAIGGIVSATLLMLVLGWAYSFASQSTGTPVTVNYLVLVVLTPVFALIGMLGDLSASVIKRQFGVKDYGNIMPGHGGVLDRFDSAMFTIPAVYIAVRYLPAAFHHIVG